MPNTDYDESEALEKEDQPYGRRRTSSQKYAAILETEQPKQKAPASDTTKPKSLSERMKADPEMAKILRGRPRKRKEGESETAYSNYLRGHRMRGSPEEYDTSAAEQRKALSPK